MKRGGIDDACEPLGKFSRIPVGKGTAETLAGNKSKNAVAKKFQTLVVRAMGGLAVRAMREGAVELLGILEMVAEDGFEFAALLWGHGAISSITI